MTGDEETLAVALWVRRTQGDRAEMYVAERIGELALAMDYAGIARWKDIAVQLDALIRGSIH